MQGVGGGANFELTYAFLLHADLHPLPLLLLCTGLGVRMSAKRR